MQAPRHLETATHPVQAALLAGTLTLAVSALLADWAYSASRDVQWINFAAWLTAGTALLAGMALLWALAALLFRRGRDQRGLITLLLVLATLGFAMVDALVHTRDGWATMPDALVLSVVVALLAFAATTVGLTRRRMEAAQ